MMSKFQHDVMLRAVKFLDVILMTLPFAACWFWYYGQCIQTPRFRPSRRLAASR